MLAFPEIGLPRSAHGERAPTGVDLKERRAWACAAAMAYAPYLKRLGDRRFDLLDRVDTLGPDEVYEAVRADFQTAQTEAENPYKLLRDFKSDTHLLTALADLSGEWDWVRVTEILSDVADLCIAYALRCAWQKAIEKRWVINAGEDLARGLFIIALGKHGARELNYSSDVDLAAFYDPDRFPNGERGAGDAAARIVREVTHLLEHPTPDGYVFRVDLRLRPDPGSTPIAVSTHMAENYYEAVGQNWERMVWIKARICAGDSVAAEAFLDVLQPFVWRRHLDYWAIADIHAIKRQIHSHGGHGDLSEPDCDVKLGRGGIREIEFFAQTQQLILGGRQPELRASRTLEGLKALRDIDYISNATAETLNVAYAFLRGLEHRIQMVNDEQTHKLPTAPEKRDVVAALCGFPDLPTFDAAIVQVRSEVHRIYSDLFAQEERLSGVGGNLVFTGVDDDPGTLKTLEDYGFKSPAQIIDRMRNWHRGSIRATRTSRGRQILTALTPTLLETMSASGEPDIAFASFGRFMEGLSSGVQVLSLLLANPSLTKALISTFTLSPKFAGDLAQRPDTLDAMLDGGFSADLSTDTCGFIRSIKTTPSLGTFEDALNQARRGFRDESFRIGFHLLQGDAKVIEAERAYTHLAETCLHALAQVAEAETNRKFGQTAGDWAICGMGSLGAGEMTASSDLDIVLIYDAEGGEARQYFTKLTQRLITALTAATEEGQLYDVDMQLRPSGRAGPVAVQMSAFEHYYRNDAWTWERMALTRFRPITGPAAFRDKLTGIVQRELQQERAREVLLSDVLDMRRRLYRERPGTGHWDLKLTEGGLLDIDFIAQWILLREAVSTPSLLAHRSVDILREAMALNLMPEPIATILIDAYELQAGLMNLQRVALSGQGESAHLPTSNALKQRLCQFADAETFDALERRLLECQAKVAVIRTNEIGPLATDS